MCRIIYKLRFGTGNLKAVISKRGGPNWGGVRAPLANLVESDTAAAMIDEVISEYC